MSYKIDLHTHSIASPDGSLRADDYKRLLETKKLDFIAITDHDRIDFAQVLQKSLGDWGSRIIVGEEITTSQGEIIGLYLTTRIEPGLSAQETVAEIHAQKGLVYIPHPFEVVREGVSEQTLQSIVKNVDIIETHNGRAVFQNRSVLAKKWAQGHSLGSAASSDAHGPHGWGRTYSLVKHQPLRDNLAEQLKAAEYSQKFVGARGLVYPKYNRLRKKLGILEKVKSDG